MGKSRRWARAGRHSKRHTIRKDAKRGRTGDTHAHCSPITHSYSLTGFGSNEGKAVKLVVVVKELRKKKGIHFSPCVIASSRLCVALGCVGVMELDRERGGREGGREGAKKWFEKDVHSRVRAMDSKSSMN